MFFEAYIIFFCASVNMICNINFDVCISHFVQGFFLHYCYVLVLCYVHLLIRSVITVFEFSISFCSEQSSLWYFFQLHFVLLISLWLIVIVLCTYDLLLYIFILSCCAIVIMLWTPFLVCIHHFLMNMLYTYDMLCMCTITLYAFVLMICIYEYLLFCIMVIMMRSCTIMLSRHTCSFCAYGNVLYTYSKLFSLRTVILK